MPSPLDIIQSVSQNILSAVKPSATDKAVNTADNADTKEPAFSSVLNQALQQQASEPAPKAGKAQSESNRQAPSQTAETPSEDREEAPEPSEPKAEGNPIDWLAVQAQLLPIAPQPLPDPAQEGLLANLAQLTQPQPQSNQDTSAAEPAAIATAATPLPSDLSGMATTSSTPEAGSTQSDKTARPEKSETLEMAQTFGFSTLSPEAMNLMGLPIEFQIQQAITQVTPTAIQPEAPSVSNLAAPTVDSATPMNAFNTATLTSQDLQPQPITMPASTQPFEQALLDASQTPAEIPNNSGFTAESAPVIETAPDILKGDDLPLAAELPTATQTNRLEQALLETMPQALVNPAPTEKAPSQSNELDALWQGESPAILPKATHPASAPPMSANAIQELQKNLNALNGEIENTALNADDSVNQAFAETSAEFALPESDKEDFSASDTSLSPTNLMDGLIPSAGMEPKAAPTENGVPQFLSNAVDPADQVADGAVYAIKNGNRELILKLNPDNLGEVRINLIRHGNNELSARLIASNPESHELLQTKVESLRASLEAQGIQIERLSVVLAGHTETGNNTTSQQDQPKQSSQHQQNNASSNQQQAFQQQEPNPNLFFQAGGQFQHKQGFAQNPASKGYGQGNGSAGNSDLSPSEPQARRNDDGSISILA